MHLFDRRRVPLLLAGLAVLAPPSTARELPLLAASRPGAPAAVALPDGRLVSVELAADATARRIEQLADGRLLVAGTRETHEGPQAYLATVALRTGVAETQPPVASMTDEAPPLPVRAGYRSHDPEPITARGELTAAAWLESRGARDQEVRVARWNGGSWGPAATLSPSGPGSQLALAAVGLADGGALLAWSRYDGEDDEVVVTRFDGTAWGSPRSIAAGNQVPDVTPAIALLPDGRPVLAWSRFDGHDYRLAVSRLDGDGWSPPLTAGGRGSARPSFLRRDGQLAILYWDHEAGGWSALELAADGTPSRRATVTGEQRDRPLATFDGGGLELRFDLAGEPSRAAWQRLP